MSALEDEQEFLNEETHHKPGLVNKDKMWPKILEFSVYSTEEKETKTIVLMSPDKLEETSSLPVLEAMQNIATSFAHILELVLECTSKVAYKDLSSPIYQRRPDFDEFLMDSKQLTEIEEKLSVTKEDLLRWPPSWEPGICRGIHDYITHASNMARKLGEKEEARK